MPLPEQKPGTLTNILRKIKSEKVAQNYWPILAQFNWPLTYERFAEKWNIYIYEVAGIYDGNICNLSREQVIRLLETHRDNNFLGVR